MITLHKLVKTIAKRKKRIGQGLGSGKGVYAGRGVKGQSARGKTRGLFEGGQLVLQKKLPMLRGKSKNKSLNWPCVVVTLAQLEAHSLVKPESVIDSAFLIKAGLVNEKRLRRSQEIKILSQGTLTKKLTVKVGGSQKAVEKIKHAGGEYQP